MSEINNLLERPRFYYNIDGMSELNLGFLLLSFAFLDWLQMRTYAQPVWNQMIVFFFPLVLLIITYGTKLIKKYVTYPRTGFVEYRMNYGAWGAMALGFAVAAFTGIGMIAVSWLQWKLTFPVAVTGLIIAAAYAYRIARATRWKWVVVGLMAGGTLLIAALPANVVAALATHPWGRFPAEVTGAFLLFCIFCGTLLSLSGAISLWLYLRHTQARVQEAQ